MRRKQEEHSVLRLQALSKRDDQTAADGTESARSLCYTSLQLFFLRISNTNGILSLPLL